MNPLSAPCTSSLSAASEDNGAYRVPVQLSLSDIGAIVEKLSDDFNSFKKSKSLELIAINKHLKELDSLKSSNKEFKATIDGCMVQLGQIKSMTGDYCNKFTKLLRSNHVLETKCSAFELKVNSLVEENAAQVSNAVTEKVIMTE